MLRLAITHHHRAPVAIQEPVFRVFRPQLGHNDPHLGASSRAAREAVGRFLDCGLLDRWADTYGKDEARNICVHGIRTPPIIVAMESCASDRPTTRPSRADEDELFKPHAQAGFVVWSGSHDGLIAFLAENPARRVQDPTSATAVDCTKDLQPRVIVDFCAGRGTKTRQLAITHPQMRIIAHDPDAQRLDDLRLLAEKFKNVEVPPQSPRDAIPRHSVDLLLLDVPCSNTGVLGRRPEARYRFNIQRLQSLVQLQQTIVEQAIPLLAPGGYLLYSTCSIEPAENQQQTQWIVKHCGARLMAESLILPAGSGVTYHAGGYYALLRL